MAGDPANAPDRDAVDDLLADHHDDENKPTCRATLAYADGGASLSG